MKIKMNEGKRGVVKFLMWVTGIWAWFGFTWSGIHSEGLFLIAAIVCALILIFTKDKAVEDDE